MRRWISLVLALLLASAGAQAQSFGGRAVSVADGDTFVLLTPEKNRIKIRLAESDAPELKQAYGKEARAELAATILRKPVTFRYVTTDKYGRMVGHVSLGSGRSAVDVAALMVQRGAAWAYLDYLTDQRFLIWEAAARKARRGLWALPTAQQIPPWQVRQTRRLPPRPPSVATIPPKSEASPARCGQKRYCKQMTSCAEATFFLTQCGLKSLDANHDGRPCEKLCAAND